MRSINKITGDVSLICGETFAASAWGGLRFAPCVGVHSYKEDPIHSYSCIYPTSGYILPNKIGAHSLLSRLFSRQLIEIITVLLFGCFKFHLV